MLTREKAINFLIKTPYKFGHLIGFDKLTVLHNDWIKKMVNSKKDETLQAHRGSYKTTCVSIALAILIILFPNARILFMRKTDTDVKEIIKQVQNILLNPKTRIIVFAIYQIDLKLTVQSATEVSTNLTTDIKGTSQLVGLGTGSSITGKHFDIIFTDDIVNVQDRISKAERDKTKIIYQELQNIKNRGGRIFNTGTPWHPDDCFLLMPNAEKFDCYQTKLISKEELQIIKQNMVASLFAANYELKHIASEDIIFTDPHINSKSALAEQGETHIDAAYHGEDYTALTILNKHDGKYYVFGKLWRKHIDDCIDDCIKFHKKYNSKIINCENNADKGYLAKQFRERDKELRITTYHESMNKFIKITSYLKGVWENVYFVRGTDEEYISQICDYSEDAEHDDAPDSLASLVRKYFKRKEKSTTPKPKTPQQRINQSYAVKPNDMKGGWI